MSFFILDFNLTRCKILIKFISGKICVKHFQSIYIKILKKYPQLDKHINKENLKFQKTYQQKGAMLIDDYLYWETNMAARKRVI